MSGAKTDDAFLAELRQLLEGRCPECGRRGELLVHGRGAERVRSWSCDGPEGEEHEGSSWDEESVGQAMLERGFSEERTRDFLRSRGRH